MTSMLTRPVAERATARLQLLLDDPYVLEHADGVVVARGRIGGSEVQVLDRAVTPTERRVAELHKVEKSEVTSRREERLR